jgi:hypothetical protein
MPIVLQEIIEQKQGKETNKQGTFDGYLRNMQK